MLPDAGASEPKVSERTVSQTSASQAPVLDDGESGHAERPDRPVGSSDPNDPNAVAGLEGSAEEADQATAQLGRLITALADPVAAKGLSLARISKRCVLPMSTLRRLLTGLEDAGLVGVTLTEDGRGMAVLTQAGRTLAASLTSG